MRKTEQIPTITWEVVEVTCDKCGKTIHRDDLFEFQELFHWEHDCGYGSVFGDGSGIDIDLCQNCVGDLLGPYMRVIRI